MLPEKRNFLLVGEDDIDDQEMLKEIFAENFPLYRLVFMTNGHELLEYTVDLQNENLPCLILLDYNMPGLNGAEILKELSTDDRYRNIPRIIWSTSGADTYKALCIEHGANDYVVKPSTIKGLIEICRYFLSHCKN
ncbi:MAG: response regulator [Agriterribacter sp.]